ncbi:hypothetical protein [Helicobacter gastrocanis]
MAISLAFFLSSIWLIIHCWTIEKILLIVQ